MVCICVLAGSCKQSSAGWIKDETFLNQLSDYRHLKKNSAPWSYADW
jgi:hypothetical protein